MNKYTKISLALLPVFIFTGCPKPCAIDTQLCPIPSPTQTKLDAAGNPLVDQSKEWNDSGDEISFDQWSCIQDTATGLTWEVKTNDGGLRDKDWTYMNNTAVSSYDPTSDADNGSCYWDEGNLSAATCDTEKYIQQVNAATLCGYSDWRLPTGNGAESDQQELQALLNCENGVDCDWVNSPLIETSVFPNTIAGRYWSSSQSSSVDAYAWEVNFYFGTNAEKAKYDSHSVRLVR